MKCRIRRKELSSQIMGDLPAEKLAGAAPFMYFAIDMFGPWLVTKLGQGQTQREDLGNQSR